MRVPLMQGLPRITEGLRWIRSGNRTSLTMVHASKPVKRCIQYIELEHDRLGFFVEFSGLPTARAGSSSWLASIPTMAPTVDLSF